MNQPTNPAPRDHAAILYQAATLVAQLLPLARAIETDAFTPTERERFRELAGRSRVFELVEALRPLCSADAHAIHRAGALGIALALVTSSTRRTVIKTYPRARSNRTEGGTR